MALPYRVIEPQTPEYWQLIHTAITTGDKETLSALRGNTGKTIRLVHGWFYYCLMASAWETDPHEVVIFTPEARSHLIATMERLDRGRELLP